MIEVLAKSQTSPTQSLPSLRLDRSHEWVNVRRSFSSEDARMHKRSGVGSKWLLISGGAFVSFVIGSLVLLGSGSSDVLDDSDKLASVGGALFAFAGLVVSVFAIVIALRSNIKSSDPVVSLLSAREDLARVVFRQWEREAVLRGLTQPDPIEVKWSSTRRRVASSAVDVLGSGVVAGKPKRLKLHGHVSGIANTFRRLPGKQLVVIGAPGSGKTSSIIAAIGQLLSSREKDEPVPVLLSLASWDPARSHLETWVSQRISEEYPAFGKRGKYGPDIAALLVERDMILPVLDGLDEIAPARLAIAIKRITQAVGRSKPLVLTCRSSEYEKLIEEHGRPIGRAAVIEMHSVTADAAADYLSVEHTDGDARWGDVVALLRSQSDGVLAEALSTPLMVYLARTAYASALFDPNDLLRFDRAAEIERHLLAAYIPAVYAEGRLGSGLEDDFEIDSSYCSAEKALKWLGYIAQRLTARKSVDFSWWNFFQLLPQPQIVVSTMHGALIGAVLGLVGYIVAVAGVLEVSSSLLLTVFSLILAFGVVVGGSIALGAMVGAVLGVLFKLLYILFPSLTRWWTPRPRYVPPQPMRIAFGLVLGVMLGVAVSATLNFIEPGPIPFAKLILAGAILGATAGVVAGAPMVAPEDAPLSPSSSLRTDRLAAITLSGWTILGVFSATAISMSSTPGLKTEPLFITFAGLLLGSIAAFAGPASSAWLRLNETRLLLVLLRKGPWRLIYFLEDAHARGVFRQVGSTYQFRHLRLQQYLAEAGMHHQRLR